MLPDIVSPDSRILFVGINPGVRSAALGHHFAGYSNRFWKLLHESGLVPEAVTYIDDVRLPEWGLGITNLIARCTPGIDTLEPEDYVKGQRALRRKVRRWRPDVVALLGVSLYRSIFSVKGPVAMSVQGERFENARVFVLPNPSGRNAHFSHAQMLAAFRRLRRVVSR